MSTLPAAFPSQPIVRIGRQHTEVQAHLQLLELTDRAGGLASLELRLDAVASESGGGQARPYDDDTIVSLGAEVYVGMADLDQPQHSMFRGRVSAIEAVWGEGGPAVIVLAEDALARLRMTRRTKVHENLHLPSLVDELVRDLQLTGDVVGFDDRIGLQVQLNESDLAFLRRIVQERDAEMQLVENQLQIRKIADLSRGTVVIDTTSSTTHCRARVDLAHQVSEVTLSGWDVSQGQKIAVTSTFTATGPGRGTTGAEALARTSFGRRTEHLGHVPVADRAEGQALADAMHAQRARQFVMVEGSVPGDPRIRVGARLTLSGAGARFSNTFLVTETTHRMDRNDGYETTFYAQSAYVGGER